MKLSVPYKSQWDPEGNKTNNDCGPACVSIVLNFYGENTTINEVFDRTGAGQGLINITQLKKAISSYGYESYFEIGKTWDDCRKLLNQGVPPILLIHYAPLSSRQDKNYKGGHFIVLTGEDGDCWLSNDPNFQGQYRSHGEQHRYLKNEMELAWAQCGQDDNPPYSFLVIKRKETMSDIYKTLDPNNKESMKKAVDLWYEVMKENKWIKIDECIKKLTESEKKLVDLCNKSLKSKEEEYNQKYQDLQDDIEETEQSFKDKKQKAVDEALKKQAKDHKIELETLQKQIEDLEKSKEYKIGKFLVGVFNIKNLIRRIKNGSTRVSGESEGTS